MMRTRPFGRLQGDRPGPRGPSLGPLRLALCLALLVASGCATLRRHGDASEAAGACRQLSREGVAALERGDAQRACTLLDQAVAASPGDVDARRQLADVLWQNGAAEEALQHIEKAVQLDPTHAATVVRAGEMLLGVGQPDRALERAEEAIVLDATLPAAWALRGRIYRQRGELDRALADLHQALRYSPSSQDVLLETAELQYQLGRPQRTLTTLQTLLATYAQGDEPRRALWLEGLAYSAVNRPDDAAAALYAASTRGATEPELLYQLARAQQASGQSAAAAATAQLAADAGHGASRTLLAELQAAGSPESGTIIR
jgi:Tfp pilus assembly protein PilF